MKISSLLQSCETSPAYEPGFLRLRIPYDRSEIEGCFSTRFSQVVRRLPEHLAVVSGQQFLTYSGLDQASDCLAKTILQYTAGISKPVALLVPHNAAAMISIVGVLKAGAIYVALDVGLPDATLQSILTDSQAILLVSDSLLAIQAKRLGECGIPVVYWDQLDSRDVDGVLNDVYSPETPAAILYTTGSTGKPKGVLRSHRRLLYHGWQATHYLGFCPSDRVTHLYSIAYGGSTTDIFYPLLTGATIISTRPANLSPSDLDAWLRRERLTVLHMPVMLYRSYMESLESIKAPESIRLVTLSGQTVRKEDVQRYKQYFAPHCILRVSLQAGEFGHATEYLIDHQTQINTETVPVGYASDGYEITILDETQKPVPHGKKGEIAIRSSQLAMGYWGQPELTVKRFINDPVHPGEKLCLTGDMGCMHPDGLLEHLGRKDFMVKIRGFRVELEFVEKKLRSVGGLKDVVILAYETPSGDNMLAAYIVPEKLPGPAILSIRQELGQELPDYMVPTEIVILDRLPLTTSGKIDRHGLPKPEFNRPALNSDYVAPRTPYEFKLCILWAEVLGWKQVGIHDRFLDLGGNSLLAMKLISRIMSEFGIDLTPQTLFEASTVASLSELIIKYQLMRMKADEIQSILGND